MGIKLMVSVWPTIDRNSSQFAEMREKGLLVRTERGVDHDNGISRRHGLLRSHQPKSTRACLASWSSRTTTINGVRIFWLDEAEPEYAVYDFDHYRYHLGPNLQVGNIYPLKYAQGSTRVWPPRGRQNIVNLLRCAWAGQSTIWCARLVG